MDASALVHGLMWFVAFLLSTTVHEALHALAALRGGDRTAYRGGQVSLSPLPHIRREPIGMLVVPLLTAFSNGWAIGWASTPYDPAWAARHPRRAARMAAAGPAGNLVIAAGAFLALKAGIGAGIFVAPARASFHHLVDAAGNASWLTGVGEMLTMLLVLNVLLCVFNMLPLPPLDGASAIGGLLPARAAGALRAFVSNPAFSLLGILVAWQIFPAIARPLFRTMLRLLHPGALYS